MYGGSIEEVGFGFAVNTSLDQEIQTLRTAALAAGQVPEPATGALLSLGGVGLVVSRRRARAAGAGFGQFA